MAGLLDKASEKSTETTDDDNAMQEPAEPKSGLLKQAEIVGDASSPTSVAEPPEGGSPLLSGMGIILLLVSMFGLYNLRVIPGIIVVSKFLAS